MALYRTNLRGVYLVSQIVRNGYRWPVVPPGVGDERSLCDSPGHVGGNKATVVVGDPELWVQALQEQLTAATTVTACCIA